jgi:hypothetical protein
MILDVSSLVPGSNSVYLAVRELLDLVVDRTRDALGDHCQAILLGGSLARHQGIAYRDGDESRLLSDLDIYVVRNRARAATEAMLGRELRSRVAEEPRIAPPLDLAFVSLDYLRTQAHTLHMQQLRNGWMPLYTHPRVDLDALIPESPVSTDEAQRLLLNRLCESVWLRGRPADIVTISHSLKLLIDAPLALLAAWGHYLPSRRQQRQRLRELLAPCSEAARARLEQGLALGEEWRRAALGQPMSVDEWQEWAERAQPVLPGYVAAVLRALLRPSRSRKIDFVSSWERACSLGGFEARDERRLRHWCRRGGRTSTFRRARQWAPLAPSRIKPWWRHGWRGSGADLVYSAGVLRWFGRERWLDPLRGLLRDLPEEPGVDLDDWFGHLWADWILGKGRR